MDKLVFKLFYPKCFILILFCILILNGCGKITGSSTLGVPKEAAKSPEVYFCPREDCGKVFESLIKSANSSVHCALYDIELKNVINALAMQSKVSDVKVVMDHSNYKGQVKGNAIRFNDEKGQQLMHNKFCVIDGNIVLTGSFNPTENDNYKNNNNVVVLYSKTLAGNYEDEFNELWKGRFGKGSKVKNPILYINGIEIENYFCPEDGCMGHIIDLIENSKSSIYFMAFSFTSGEIASALIKKEGIDIKGIMDSEQSSNKFSQLKRLQGFGINVKKDSNKYKMHHKVFIIDNETIATGSFNPTSSADSKNDENLLIIHDKKTTDEFLKEFVSLW